LVLEVDSELLFVPSSVGWCTKVVHWLHDGNGEPPVPASVRVFPEGKGNVAWAPFKEEEGVEFGDFDLSMGQYGGYIVNQIKAGELFPELVHDTHDQLFVFAWFAELPLRWFQDPGSAGMNGVELVYVVDPDKRVAETAAGVYSKRAKSYKVQPLSDVRKALDGPASAAKNADLRN